MIIIFNISYGKMFFKTWVELIEERKRNDHTQKMINYEDKVSSKIIAQKSGCPVPETYYVGKSASKIPFDKLPERYVVKPTHHASSKGIFLMNQGINVFNGKETTQKNIIKTEKKYLSKTLSKKLGEWATYQIPRRVLVEEFLPNLEGKYVVPDDYKLFVFHGRVCLVRVKSQKKTKLAKYFNREFEIIDFDTISDRIKKLEKSKSPGPSGPTKPLYYDEMIDFAEKMGKEFGDFIRIDMYLTPTGPYFGEFTLYPGSGRYSHFTKTINQYMGVLWQMPDLVLGKDQRPFTKAHFEKVLKMSFNYKNKLLANVTHTHAPTSFPKFKPNPKSKKCPKCSQRRGL